MAKQLETVSGPVEQVNQKGTGIKVLGEWLNISQYHPINPMPTAGELVECTVEHSDRGVWINSLRIVGARAVASTSDRDREIRRLACLKAAATFASRKALNHDITSADVLRVAEAFERWVSGGDAAD